MWTPSIIRKVIRGNYSTEKNCIIYNNEDSLFYYATNVSVEKFMEKNIGIYTNILGCLEIPLDFFKVSKKTNDVSFYCDGCRGIQIYNNENVLGYNEYKIIFQHQKSFSFCSLCASNTYQYYSERILNFPEIDFSTKMYGEGIITLNYNNLPVRYVISSRKNKYNNCDSWNLLGCIPESNDTIYIFYTGIMHKHKQTSTLNEQVSMDNRLTYLCFDDFLPGYPLECFHSSPYDINDEFIKNNCTIIDVKKEIINKCGIYHYIFLFDDICKHNSIVDDVRIFIIKLLDDVF